MTQTNQVILRVVWNDSYFYISKNNMILNRNTMLLLLFQSEDKSIKYNKRVDLGSNLITGI